SVWIHAASLGEFEQGRPLIEKIKSKFPNQKIVLTFFSPSGYDIQKNYSNADIVTYFLSDNKSDVKRMLELFKPSLVIFIKYEFWFHTIKEIIDRKIPLVFISTVMRKDSYLLNPIASQLLRLLARVDKIFLQDKTSFKLLEQREFRNIELVGDTRLDRVIEIASQEFSDDIILHFISNRKVLVIGSLWESDLNVIALDLHNFIHEGWKIIIAPHKIEAQILKSIESIFYDKTSRYSSYENMDKQVLLIDQIGLLSRLYRFADFVYIGGGFGQGIHNILEPLAYCKPVAFGPKFHKFKEAEIAIEFAYGFEINEVGQLVAIATKMTDSELKRHKQSIQEYLDQNRDASEKIFQYLQAKKWIPIC
ncbi:MAG: glycosyltransferase N-terminal domain-containing protein, partial [Saprospiraceae bacterium]